jgi:hypothetical protein
MSMWNRVIIILAIYSIGNQGIAQSVNLFESLLSSQTGITFKNVLDETPTSNVLTYEYFYNGGGVAVGDINNDGLEDIYFSANMKPNVLYLNQGNMNFKDITLTAGVSSEQGWKTGVTMVDINGDGFLDIYVSHSGKGDPEKRRNKLFINNGDLTFSEQAKAYGLDDPGHSTHATFFDYDLDGDLDMYLLNHNVTVIREVEFDAVRKTRHPYAGDKFFRNDNGKFVDISARAGIKGSPLGFGLGVTVADINQDGWQDIYVSNDYIEPDYLYINNHNGTFTDKMTEYMQHISYFSMGSDVSDINNDGWVDIFTTDMLPKSNKRQKLLYGPENYEHYALMVLNGFYFQNMRNMFHLNNSNGTYSEIGQFAGVSNTDWSWAPLFADFDNDGLKDLFITNGYYRDYTNRDFLKYKGDYFFEKAKVKEKADTFHLVSTMNSTPVHNFMYKNKGDLTFSDQSEAWGFGKPGFSSGAAYVDLDNDGDLDILVNNQNETASLYKNLSREQHPDQHYLQLTLRGSKNNPMSVGARIYVYTGNRIQYIEKMPTRGFQSSVTQKIHIGTGTSDKIDSIKIKWPYGNETLLKNIDADQLIEVYEMKSESGKKNLASENESTWFTKVDTKINYAHIEPGYNDFKRQPLILTMYTACGPVQKAADVNNDGLLDVYVGGAQDNPGKLYVQGKDGSFSGIIMDGNPAFTDADAVFFDADNDGDMDLYVVSGGYNEYEVKDAALQDRLYINDGKGQFSKASKALPDNIRGSKSCVRPVDFDHDGDLDLFVGGRVVPGQYPVIPESFLLENKGKGIFENVAALKAKDLSRIGMVTDASWSDFNGDSWPDLIVAGEFMPIEVFINKGGKTLERSTGNFFDKPLSGMWNKLTVFDFDQDGDDDIIAGNFGLNSQLNASDKEPVSIFYKDFDKNGSIDPIMTVFIEGQEYPFASRDELLDQMYSMRSKYTSYASYSEAKLQDIFSKNDLKDAKVLRATTLETIYLENHNGKFIRHQLPGEAQFTPVYSITPIDYNKDGKMDLLLHGNQSSIRIRMGVIDASFGQLFEGDGKGGFRYISQAESGLTTVGDVKSCSVITINSKTYLLIGVNNVGVETYKLNSK